MLICLTAVLFHSANGSCAILPPGNGSDSGGIYTPRCPGTEWCSLARHANHPARNGAAWHGTQITLHGMVQPGTARKSPCTEWCSLARHANHPARNGAAWHGMQTALHGMVQPGTACRPPNTEWCSLARHADHPARNGAAWHGTQITLPSLFPDGVNSAELPSMYQVLWAASVCQLSYLPCINYFGLPVSVS